MKKFLLLFGAASIALVGVAAPASREAKSHKSVNHREAPWSPKGMMPSKISQFYWGWDETSAQWEPQETTYFTYDDFGKVLTETSEYNKREYTYNDNGLVTTETEYWKNNENGTWTPGYKSEYTYDDVIKDFKIKSVNYNYENGAWVKSSESGKNITRNAQGNIIRIVDTSDGREYDDPLTISYGADGKANEMIYWDGEDVDIKYTDIVWAQTDGQIVEGEFDDDDFYTGYNKIASATIATYRAFDQPLYLTASYGERNSYKFEVKYNGEVILSTDVAYLDNNGSYEKTEFEIDYDNDDDVMVRDGEYTFTAKRMYNEFGLMTSYTSRDVSIYDDSSNEEIQNELGEVTLNEDGYPKEYITKYSYNDGDYTNSTRVLYDDYVAIAGVEDVAADADATVEYYNLQGMRVAEDNLTTGIYIRRQGSKTSKILVK